MVYDFPDINAAELLLQAAPPERTALVWGERSISYGELRLAASRAAWVWNDCGVQRGEPVLLRLQSGLERTVAMLGAMWAGAVPVPLAPALPERAWQVWALQARCRFVLDDTREGYTNLWRDKVLTLAEWRDAMEEARPDVPRHLPAAAPACWTDFGGAQPSKLLSHAFVFELPFPQPHGSHRSVRTHTTQGLLRGLRRAATVVIAAPSAPREARALSFA